MRLPYPTVRYVGETERLYGVLDHALQGRDYIVGAGRGRYSIADIASFGWVNMAYFCGIYLEMFPDVEKWWKRISARPAVQKGIAVPNDLDEHSGLGNKEFQRLSEEDEEFEEYEDGLTTACYKAKRQYDYKYGVPLSLG